MLKRIKKYIIVLLTIFSLLLLYLPMSSTLSYAQNLIENNNNLNNKEFTYKPQSETANPKPILTYRKIKRHNWTCNRIY